MEFLAPDRIECNEIPLVDSTNSSAHTNDSSEIRHMNDEVIYLVALLDNNEIL